MKGTEGRLIACETNLFFSSLNSNGNFEGPKTKAIPHILNKIYFFFNLFFLHTVNVYLGTGEKNGYLHFVIEFGRKRDSFS